MSTYNSTQNTGVEQDSAKMLSSSKDSIKSELIQSPTLDHQRVLRKDSSPPPLCSTRALSHYQNSLGNESLLPTPTPTPTPIITRAPFDHQSSPSNSCFSLPQVPTSVQFNQSNPGNQPHSQWTPLFVHTAKCDGCSNHNTEVIQRCNRCNRQLCKTCITSASNDGIHVANVNELDWTPKSQAKPTLLKIRRPIGKVKAVVLSTSNRMPKVTKVAAPTPRKTTRATASRLLLEAEKQVSQTTEQPLFVSKPENQSQQDDGLDEDSETDEDPLIEELVRADHERRRPKQLKIVYKKGVHWAHPLQVSAKSSDTLTEESMYGLGTSVSTGATMGPAMSKPMKFGDIPAEFGAQIRGESFAEVLAEVKEMKERAAMQARERAFEYEKNAAWENDPLIRDLKVRGKDKEAMELFEHACILIRSRRGFP